MKMLLSVFFFIMFLVILSQVVCLSSSPSTPQCHPDEASALIQFSASFKFFTYTMCYRSDEKPTTRWNKRADCCTWPGVTCDNVTGLVIGLHLSCSKLQGIISSNNTLFKLRHLQVLDLSFNDFRGSPIVSEFGLFKNLTQLRLMNSNFSNHVPLEISHLTKLVSLELGGIDNNKLSIGAPTFKALSQNLTNLTYLFLDKIDMSSVPPVLSFNNFSSLTSLFLSDCKFHGKHLHNIFLVPKLQHLYLFEIDAPNGSFPRSNWSSTLETLYLINNYFSIDLSLLFKNIPSSLSDLSLSNSNLVVADLPVLLVNLTHLVSLDISHNYFTGKVPHFLFNQKQLLSLDLSFNEFVGPLSALFTNLTNVVSLDISYNHLTGKIPNFLFNQKQLRSLDLSYNDFVGPLPENLSFHDLSNNLAGCAPSNFTSLRLIYNKLNGTIPSWIYALPYLEELDLSNNQLTGEIGEFQSSSLYELSLGNNMLNGLIPISLFHNLKDLSHLDLSFNNLSVTFDNSKNHSFDNIQFLKLSSCNITEFTHFLKYSKKLDSLDLSLNKIQGIVPTWLWEVGKNSLIYLNLSHNHLTYMYPLPWNNLQYLDLRSNFFSGSLPIASSPLLKFFSVSKNQLVGEIPTSICNLSSLLVLDLSFNNLSGIVPQCMSNFSEKLSVMDLRSNKLHGTIPTTFAKGNSLRNLNVNGNHLEGRLPRTLMHCRNLEVLDLGNNLLNDTFPHWLESLPQLRVLILRSNLFYGSIGKPKIKFPFPELRILDLSNNEFGGVLPTEYFDKFEAMKNAENEEMEYMGDKLYQDSVTVILKGYSFELVRIQNILTIIDFSCNNFTGDIPKLLGELKSLKGLNFSFNMLRGTIPSSFGKLTNLEWLDLAANKLVGNIPSQLTDLTMLEKLNLSQNQLTGLIPTGKQFNTFCDDSFKGNLNLSGFQLSKACNQDPEGRNSPRTTLEQASDSEFTNGFTWKVVVMGYGCGLVFGILMGYVKFFTKQKAS